MVNFLMKAMLKSQLKGVPEEQVNQILGIIEKNPEFFKKMGEEIRHKVKSGMSQQDAMNSFMTAHKDELQSILGEIKSQ